MSLTYGSAPVNVTYFTVKEITIPTEAEYIAITQPKSAASH